MRECPTVATYTGASGAIAIRHDLGIVNSKAILKEIRVHLSGVGGRDSLTVAVDSVSGAEHDAVLSSSDLTAAADLILFPDSYLEKGDKLNIDYANANDRTWGVKLFYVEL